MTKLTHPQRQVLQLALQMLGNRHLLKWSTVKNSLHGVVMTAMLFDGESPALSEVKNAAIGLHIEEMK